MIADLGVRAGQLVYEGALGEHRQECALLLAEPELREIVVRLGLELEPRPELIELADEPLLGEVRLCAHEHDGSNVELAAGDQRQRDRVLDDELARIDRERPCGTRRDQPAPQADRLVGLQTRQLGEEIDLIAMGGRRHPAGDVAHLRGSDEVAGQGQTDRRVADQRGLGPDDDPLGECDPVRLAVGACDGELARQPTQAEGPEGHAPRTVRDGTAREDGHQRLHQRRPTNRIAAIARTITTTPTTVRFPSA